MSRLMDSGSYDVWSEMQRDAAPSVTVLKDECRKARKAYDCSGCKRRQIQPGETHNYVAEIVDGEFMVSRTCLGFYAHYGEGCEPSALPCHAGEK